MKIDELTTGPELDALVAEKVMGWRRVSEGEPYFWPTQKMIERIKELHPDVLAVDYFPAPLFSTDIAVAWVVVDHLTEDEERKHPLYFTCTYNWAYKKDGEKYGKKAYAAFDWKLTGDKHPFYQGSADTMQHAICLAALEAVSDPDDEEE